jgi:hypothetical protein
LTPLGLHLHRTLALPIHPWDCPGRSPIQTDGRNIEATVYRKGDLSTYRL